MVLQRTLTATGRFEREQILRRVVSGDDQRFLPVARDAREAVALGHAVHDDRPERVVEHVTTAVYGHCQVGGHRDRRPAADAQQRVKVVRVPDRRARQHAVVGRAIVDGHRVVQQVRHTVVRQRTPVRQHRVQRALRPVQADRPVLAAVTAVVVLSHQVTDQWRRRREPFVRHHLETVTINNVSLQRYRNRLLVQFVVFT